MYFIISACLYYIFAFYFLDIFFPFIFNKIEFFINQYNLKIEETEKLKRRYFELLFLLINKTIEPYQIVELFKIEKLLPRDTVINYYDLINYYNILEADIKKEYDDKNFIMNFFIFNDFMF